MNKLARRLEDSGVSPVIGVILMVAITVTLASILAYFAIQIGDNQTQPTTAGVDISETENGVNIQWLQSGNADSLQVTVDGETISDAKLTEPGSSVVVSTDEGDTVSVVSQSSSGTSSVVASENDAPDTGADGNPTVVSKSGGAETATSTPVPINSSPAESGNWSMWEDFEDGDPTGFTGSGGSISSESGSPVEGSNYGSFTTSDSSSSLQRSFSTEPSKVSLWFNYNPENNNNSGGSITINGTYVDFGILIESSSTDNTTAWIGYPNNSGGTEVTISKDTYYELIITQKTESTFQVSLYESDGTEIESMEVYASGPSSTSVDNLLIEPSGANFEVDLDAIRIST